MAWFTPFIVPALMNAPELLRTGNVGTYAQNVGLGGATNSALGGVTPSDLSGSALNASPQVANNIPSHLIGPQSKMQGILSNVTSNSGIVGGNNLLGAGTPTNFADRSMMETLSNATQQGISRPTEQIVQDLGQKMTPAFKNINPALVADKTKIPNEMLIDTAQIDTEGMYVDLLSKKYRPALEDNLRGQSAEYTGGGYEPSILEKAKDIAGQGVDWIKDNPLLAGIGAYGVYKGINPPEQPVPPAPLGPQLGGKQVAFAAPLKVYRRRG